MSDTNTIQSAGARPALPIQPPASDQAQVSSAVQDAEAHLRDAHRRTDAILFLRGYALVAEAQGGTLAPESIIEPDGESMTVAEYVERHGIAGDIVPEGGDRVAHELRFHSESLRRQASDLHSTERLSAQNARDVAVASAAYQLTVTDPILGLQSVNAEGFIALLRTNIDQADRRVMTTRTRIERNVAHSRRIGERLEVLQTIHQRTTQDPGVENIQVDTIEMPDGELISIARAIEVMDLGGALNIQDLEANTDIETDSAQSAIDAVRQEQSRVTSTNELDMITLQQLMQDRGRQIQLVSKILGMLSQTQDAVIANFR